jgi:hypothetical protein
MALALALLIAGLPLGASARQSAPNADAAAEAAQTYLDLATQGNFNALFDYLHPDVLDEVPRSVGLAIFQGVYGATRPGPARIGQPEPVSYTWPVNGETYDAVEVPYEQTFTNAEGQQESLQSLMYLAPFEGQFRWFLGNSRAYVAEAVARFAPPPPSEQPGDIGALLDLVVKRPQYLLRHHVPGHPGPLRRAGVRVVGAGESASTACGPAQPGFWAFYCPADATVYLDQPFLQDLEQRYGDFAAAYVVGHEWAHHVQTVSGTQRTEVPDQINEVYSIDWSSKPTA